MRRLSRLVGTALLSLVPALAQTAPSNGPYDTLVIRGGIMIDGTGAPPRGPVDITIHRNIITQVSPSDPIGRAQNGGGAQLPAGARVIDAAGKYVIPGLIDLHMHLQDSVPLEYQYKLLLGHGITTVRTFGVGNLSLDEMVAERQRITDNKVVGPRLYLYPFWRNSPTDPRFSSAKDAAEVVKEWKRKGMDGIKMAGLPGEYPDVFKAVADQAKLEKMGLAVHIAQEAVFPMNAVRTALDGATTVEHHYGYAEASFTDRVLQKLPNDYNYASEPDRFYQTGAVWLQADMKKLHTDVIDSLVGASKKNGFTMVPTMVVYEANRDLERVKTLPWHEKYTMPQVMAHWQPSPSSHGSYFYHWTTTNEADWAKMYRRWMEFVEDFKNHGGLVGVGSDVGSIYTLWGFGTIRELELLQHSGFSPIEVVHSATEIGAQALGNKQLGAIRPGYLADMVVLDENPLDDFKILYGTGATRQSATGQSVQTTAVKYTIRDGIVFDSQALLKDVRDMVSKAKAPNARPATAAAR